MVTEKNWREAAQVRTLFPQQLALNIYVSL